MRTRIIIIVVFFAVLAASIGIRLFADPAFTGFKSESFGEPVVTHLSGSPAGSENSNSGGVVQENYNWEEHPVFIVGDSLTQGARSVIDKAIGGGTIDGKVNRNMSEGLEIIKHWDETGALADDAIIIVCLAHNIADNTVRDAEKIVDMIRPGQSLIMMTGHGRSNMMPINEYIRSLPRAYSYITVADWDLTVSQNPNLLADDGIHIGKKQGNELYAELILRALEATKPLSE